MIRLFIVEITGEKKDKKLLDKTRASAFSPATEPLPVSLLYFARARCFAMSMLSAECAATPVNLKTAPSEP